MSSVLECYEIPWVRDAGPIPPGLHCGSLSLPGSPLGIQDDCWSSGVFAGIPDSRKEEAEKTMALPLLPVSYWSELNYMIPFRGNGAWEMWS